MTIQNNRRGITSSGVVVIHDNARPHCVRVKIDILKQNKWEVFDHQPYIPNLAQKDIFSSRFETMLMYEACIEKFVTRYNKYSKRFCDYIKTGMSLLLYFW